MSAAAFSDLGCFKCDGCEHVFKALPGPFVHCPKCGSLYAQWVDYLRFSRERCTRKR